MGTPAAAAESSQLLAPPARRGGPATASAELARSAGGGVLGVVVLYAAMALPIAFSLWVWRGVSYWEFSEGAYALTARMLLEGASLYTDVLAAQPPLLFYAGAAVLAIEDSIEALRAALVLPLLVTGLLVALSVWRLTWSRAAAVAGGLASLLTPWTLHEQTLLMPETLAAPLLMFAAVLAASETRARWGGATAAIAASLKLAFVLPLAALAVATRRRARASYAAGALVTLVVLWALFVAWHGGALLENVFQAQWETGRQPPRRIAGLWLQAGWNLGPMILLAGVAWSLRRRARDPRLLACLAGLAAGSVALLLTLVKHGSYLNVLALAEPPLVALAAAGLHWLWVERRACAGLGPGRGGRPSLALAGPTALVLLVAVQSLSLVATPGRPALFAHPFSQAAHGWGKSGAAVERSVQRARRRSPVARPARNPYIAFLARRPVPGGQPDRFILKHAAVHADVRHAVVLESRPAGSSGKPRARARLRSAPAGR